MSKMAAVKRALANTPTLIDRQKNWCWQTLATIVRIKRPNAMPTPRPMWGSGTALVGSSRARALTWAKRMIWRVTSGPQSWAVSPATLKRPDEGRRAGESERSSLPVAARVQATTRTQTGDDAPPVQKNSATSSFKHHASEAFLRPFPDRQAVSRVSRPARPAKSHLTRVRSGGLTSPASSRTLKASASACRRANAARSELASGPDSREGSIFQRLQRKDVSVVARGGGGGLAQEDTLGRLERAPVAEVHHRRYPAEGQEREERGRRERRQVRIVE